MMSFLWWLPAAEMKNSIEKPGGLQQSSPSSSRIKTYILCNGIRNKCVFFVGTNGLLMWYVVMG